MLPRKDSPICLYPAFHAGSDRLLAACFLEVVTIIAKSIAEVLTNVWVTSYLFPVAGGLWLSFFTANLVMLRTARARTIATLNNLRWELYAIRAASVDELKQEIFRLGQPILDVADELAASGYVRTAREYRAAILALQNPISLYAQSLTIQHLGEAGNDKALADKALKQLIPTAGTMIIDYSPKAIEHVRKVPIEWLAALELTTLARFWDEHAHRSRGSCERRNRR